VAVRLISSAGTLAWAEDASAEEVGLQNNSGEIEDEGQEGEGFHGPLAAAVAGASVGSEEVAVVLVIVLGLEDESRQPANYKTLALRR